MIKKLFKMILAIALVFAMFTPVAFAGLDHYVIHVYRDQGFTSGPTGNELITSGVQYQVMTAGSEVAMATLYSDKALTAKVNPVSATVFNVLDRIEFYVADTATSVDIIVVDNAGGFTLFLDGITPGVKNCIINERPGELHHGMIWWDASCTATDTKEVINDADTDGYDTGINFSAGVLIDRVDVRVITDVYFSAAGLLNVGLGATSHGLLHDQLIEGQGYAKARYWSDTSSIGTLMLDKGSDGAEYTVQPYFIGTAASLNYGFTSADDTEAGENTVAGGYIHYFFTPLMPR